MRFSRLSAAILVFQAVAWASAAYAVTPLMPHRAVYDLALDRASDRSGITGLTGRMVYEFNGSPCEGYTVQFRFVTKVDTSENSRVTDQQTTTFEEGNGASFSFVTKSFTDQTLERDPVDTPRFVHRGDQRHDTARDHLNTPPRKRLQGYFCRRSSSS